MREALAKTAFRTMSACGVGEWCTGKENGRERKTKTKKAKRGKEARRRHPHPRRTRDGSRDGRLESYLHSEQLVELWQGFQHESSLLIFCSSHTELECRAIQDGRLSELLII